MTQLIARTPTDLALYEPLSVPIWVFDLDSYKIWWANESALAF